MMAKKRINTAAKGKRKEKACADELIAKGYTIGHKTIRVQFHNLDLFKLFDIMALSPDGDHLLFVQTKSNKCDSKSRDAIQKFRLPPNCHKEIWIWKDRKYWIKEYYE